VNSLRVLTVGLVLALLAGGCWFLGGAALGGAAAVYVKGEASKLYPERAAQVYEAALEALKEVDVVVTEKLHGEEVSTIRGRTAGGKELTMRIEPAGSGVTRVKLRIGLMGDRDYSALILNRMERALGL